MSELERDCRTCIGYEYKEVNVDRERASLYLDGYVNFGWKQDDNCKIVEEADKVALHLKRNRKIRNRTELTRLQRNFEDCLKQLDRLEKSKKSASTSWAIGIGVVGTMFIAGSTFAVTASPPIIWLCVLLAIPGLAGWIAPYFVFRYMCTKRIRKVTPLMEDKYNEIYDICEKGNHLLTD